MPRLRQPRPTRKEIGEYVENLAKNGTQEQKRVLLHGVLKHLFKSVTLEDFGTPIKQLSDSQRRSLQADAEMIEKNRFWLWLKDTMLKIASKRMFEEARNEDDIIFAKAMLYTLDVMDKKVKNVAR